MPSVWREYCCCDNVFPKAWDSVALWTRIKLALGEPVFERPVDVEGLRGIPPGTWAHQTVSLSKMGPPRIWSKEDDYFVEKEYEVPKGYWRRPQERLRATTTGLWWLILLLAVPATCQLRMNVWTHALLQCSAHHLVTLRRHDRAHCCHCPESAISRCSHGPSYDSHKGCLTVYILGFALFLRQFCYHTIQLVLWDVSFIFTSECGTPLKLLRHPK